MGGATDYIGRVRARVETDAERQRREAEARPAARHITVLVTRDGAESEELYFVSPPTLADLVARVGTGAYVLGVGLDVAPAHRPAN